MNLLDPWWSVEKEDANYHKTFIQELRIEIPSGHKIFELPVKMLARGSGDDTLFEIDDGSKRVAVVHLTWAKQVEHLPYPLTTIYENLDEFFQSCMLPQHELWKHE